MKSDNYMQTDKIIPSHLSRFHSQGIILPLLVLFFISINLAGCSFSDSSKQPERGTDSSGEDTEIEKSRKPTSKERSKAKQHVRRAYKLKKAGRLNRAMKALAEASELDPENFSVELELARYYSDLDDFNRCYKHASRAVTANPNDAEIRLIRAKAAFHKAIMGDKEKFEKQGLTDLEKALALDPKNPRVYFCYGVWRLEEKKNEEAITYFNKAIALSPNDISYLRFRAMAYSESGQTDKAIADFTRAIKIDPTSWKTRLALGNIYDQTNQLQKAYEQYTILTRSSPDVFTARNLRAAVSVKMKNYKSAIKDLSEIVTANGLDDNALKRRADVYMLAKDYINALHDYDRAIELNPDIVEYYLARAECHDKLGNKDLSQADRAKVKKINSKPVVEKL